MAPRILLITFVLMSVLYNIVFSSPAPVVNRDGEIIASLNTLNKNEIAVANVALNKSRNPDVRDYAQMLKIEHTKNLEDTLQLSKTIDLMPSETQTVFALQKQGQNEKSRLRAIRSNAIFQASFIEAMMDDHKQALRKIDRDLKSVTNPQLKNHLQMTRENIAMHLEKAKELQKKLDLQKSLKNTESLDTDR